MRYWKNFYFGRWRLEEGEGIMHLPDLDNPLAYKHAAPKP
jgi:hypothetical protein